MIETRTRGGMRFMPESYKAWMRSSALPYSGFRLSASQLGGVYSHSVREAPASLPVQAGRSVA